MAAKKKSPRTLPQVTNRPPRSECLRAFDQAVTVLNDYFHGTRAAWKILQKQLKAGNALTGSDFIDLAKRLNVQPADLHDRIDCLEGTHRLVCLVHVVAAYEDYLKQLVQSVLRQRPLPKDRKSKIEIEFDHLDGAGAAVDFIHLLWAEQEASRVVAAGYAERPAEVRRALGVAPEELEGDRAPKFDLNYVQLACLMRNGVVHDGSRIDGRLKKGLEKVGLSGSVGAPIPLTDDLLLKLFGQLHAHAEALDLLVRWEPNTEVRS